MFRIIYLGILLLLSLRCSREEVSIEFEHIFDQVWSDFNRVYPYFELKQVDWDSIYQVYRPKIKKVNNEVHLCALLSEMLNSLRDIHVYISTPNHLSGFEKRTNYRANPKDNVSHYIDNISVDNKRVLFANIKNTDLAYLQILTFSGSVNNYVDFPTETIVSAISKKKGVIIDLRDNQGGKEDFAKDFANRFASRKKIYKYIRARNGTDINQFDHWQEQTTIPINPIKYNNPIVLLTNRGSYSATESFVLMMKTLPHVQIVGDTTGGATGNPQIFETGNWRYSISTVQVVNTHFDLIEDHGIAPDYPIEMSNQSIINGQDLILEKAIQIIQ